MLAKSKPLLPAITLIILLVTAWLVYSPGLHGGFVFDDFANLPALGDSGAVDNRKAFIYYITAGIADPIGRPLSMLSFLLDANTWPADPEPFKRTNILLHLLNGTLLCWLLVKLGKFKVSTERAEFAALLSSGIWLLHPFWTSTTLYIVQREAMLPATFILTGLLGYLHGREQMIRHANRGRVWALGSIGICTTLAVLCKANGLLLPLFAIIVEHIFLRQISAPPPRRLDAWLSIAVYPLVCVVLCYLLYAGYEGVLHGAQSFRPWTYAQRLLTEPRVVVDYVGCLILPRPYSRGLFNDNFIISTGLFDPWSTLPSILLIAGLLILAVQARKRFTELSLAILFYFAGHTMESTTIPLELYFEHRNYVPALLLFWPLGMWLANLETRARLKFALTSLILFGLAAETYAAANLWGDQHDQALVWAAKNPDSPRAQAYAASVERARGRYKAAEVRLRMALKEHPDSIQIAINLLGVRCELGSIAADDFIATQYAIRHGSTRGPLTFDWVLRAIDLMQESKCSGVTELSLQTLIDAAKENQQAMHSPRFQQDLLHMEAMLALARGDAPAAEKKFLAALDAAPTASAALEQAALLGSRGLPRFGLEQLDNYKKLVPEEIPPRIVNMESLHAWLLWRDSYWDTQIAHMRQTLEEDVAKAGEVARRNSQGNEKQMH